MSAKYIIIPRFIQKALQRQKLPLAQILNFDEMEKTLSVNDIVLLATLQSNEYWERLLNCGKFSDTIPRTNNEFYYGSYLNIYDLWYHTTKSERTSNLVKVFANLVESGQAKDEIVERLFNNKLSNNKLGVDYAVGERPDNIAGQTSVTSVESSQELAQPYEIIDIGPKCYGIIIESGAFPNRDLSNKLIRDILKSMYIYMSQSEVSRTPFFELYLNRL